MKNHVSLARKNVNYWIEGILHDYTEGILEKMEQQNLNKNQLSKKMGVSREYIYKVFNYTSNMSIGTMMKIAFALGFTLKLDFVPLEGDEKSKAVQIEQSKTISQSQNWGKIIAVDWSKTETTTYGSRTNKKEANEELAIVA